jgi:hypothetical protein
MKVVDQIVKDEIRNIVFTITDNSNYNVYRVTAMPARTHRAFIHIRVAVARELREHIRN